MIKMPYWKCNKCGYILNAEMPPKESICPSCKNSCTFTNVTCYVPECGHTGEGEEHIDPRL